MGQTGTLIGATPKSDAASFTAMRVSREGSMRAAVAQWWSRPRSMKGQRLDPSSCSLVGQWFVDGYECVSLNQWFPIRAVCGTGG